MELERFCSAVQGKGCLGKGGFYRGLSCGWEVNPCEKGRAKGRVFLEALYSCTG